MSGEGEAQMSKAELFHEEMLWLCDETTRAVYNPQRFRQMVYESGGVYAVKQLLNAPELSDGFSRLWEASRLDLTVEACAIKDEWSCLFSDAELATARHRLQDLGYI